jgi:tetratricopeptide (TPR) repeat protein
MDLEQIFAKAIGHHQDGRLPEAEALYQQILNTEPNHADALYYLGRIANERGQAQQALALIGKSLEIAPSFPDRANNLGTIYQGQANLDAATRWFEAAISLDDQQTEAHFNLATILQIQGRTELAERNYRRAIELNPDFAAAYSNLSTLLRLQGRYDEAAATASRAVELSPQSSKAHNNLGVALHELNDLMAAFKCFRQAIELDPNYAEAYNNMGSVFRDENHLEGAIASYQKAIDLAPQLADAHNNLGSVLQRQGDYDAALGCFEKALALNPEFPPALANMGVISHRKNRQQEALQYFRRALAVDAEYAEAHFNISEVLLLTQSDLQPGWAEHHWRWRKHEFRLQWRDFCVPVWDGCDPSGKNIAVWGEQGIGEEIMYAGMIPDLLKAGASVIIECEPRLAPLFQRSFPSTQCLERTLQPPSFAGRLDTHIPAGDLGAVYRPDIDDFPAQPSYLIADTDRREELRARYGKQTTGPLVGLSWFSRNPEIGWEKSIDLEDWRALLDVLGVTFVDLQYGDTKAQREAFKAETGIEIIHDDGVDQLADLDAFAAQVAAMDLVISISNTTVHMAGALGVPTWVLLSEVPLWRWFQDREDSPWYPSVRLFRQRESGKWDDIVGEAADELRDWVTTKA